MPRWLRVVRGMIGTGVTFAAGVGVVGLLFGVILVSLGKASWDDLRFIGRLSVASFIVGVAFSGVLALVARGRTFEKLSLPFVTALGAGGGVLYWLFLSANGGRNWTASLAILNFVTLVVLGGGSAAAMLLIGRRAGRALTPGEDRHRLEEAPPAAPLAQREQEKSVR